MEGGELDLDRNKGRAVVQQRSLAVNIQSRKRARNMADGVAEVCVCSLFVPIDLGLLWFRLHLEPRELNHCLRVCGSTLWARKRNLRAGLCA